MKTRLSDLTVKETIEYLTEIGDSENANEIAQLVDESPVIESVKISDLDDNPRLKRAQWRGTEHSFGYISANENDSGSISFAGSIEPDKSLIGKKVNILLGGLYTMNYPGWGRHNVLIHFNVNHTIGNKVSESQSIQFQQKFKSMESEGAGDMGNFVFVGVKVPDHGLEFEVKTINVSNEMDEDAIKVLEDDVVKQGLNLLNASAESMSVVTSLGKGLLNLILTRNRNKIVQEFTLGLSTLSGTDPVAKLRTGTYIAAQARRDVMDWSQWKYHSGKGIVTLKNDPDQRLPYNHILFSVLPLS